MSMVQPTSRLSVTQDGGYTRIEVPARRPFFIILFLTFWLCLWTVGGLAALAGLFDGTGDAAGNLFSAIWLCVWAFGWIYTAISLAWMGFGTDTLWIGSSQIGRKLSVGALSKSYEYDVTHAKRTWFKKQPIGSTSAAPWSGNSVVMSYGGKQVKFANGVDETEAQIILDTLTSIAGIPQK